MQSDGRPTAKVGIDDELLDLIDLAQLHLCSRRDVVFQFLVVHRSPKAKTGGTCRPSLLAVASCKGRGLT